jgi:hypothetical protein
MNRFQTVKMNKGIIVAFYLAKVDPNLLKVPSALIENLQRKVDRLSWSKPTSRKEQDCPYFPESKPEFLFHREVTGLTGFRDTVEVEVTSYVEIFTYDPISSPGSRVDHLNRVCY